LRDLALSNQLELQLTGDRPGIRGFQRRIGLRTNGRERLKLNRFAHEPVNCGRVAAYQSVRSFRNGVKDRLYIGR
jgi:hypothetical protein